MKKSWDHLVDGPIISERSPAYAYLFRQRRGGYLHLALVEMADQDAQNSEKSSRRTPCAAAGVSDFEGLCFCHHNNGNAKRSI